MASDEIPFGYCHCGCGQKTKINTRNRRGSVSGEPNKFIKGHTTAAESRFWAKVDKSGECWEWLAAKDQDGYGVFSPTGTRTIKAHRFSYQLANGPIPSGSGYHGVCLLHKCDNPGCVNPEHLSQGSQRDNMADCAKKKRSSAGRGEKHRSSKLTERQVIEIRGMANNKVRYLDIAAIYEVSAITVYEIAARKTWRNIYP